MKLSVYKNSGLIKEVEIAGSAKTDLSSNEEYFIGRSADCHVILDGQLISRHHASIKCSGDKWEINKLSSMGDLLINGNPCAQSTLNSGDIISIGPFNINFSNAESATKDNSEIKLSKQINNSSDESKVGNAEQNVGLADESALAVGDIEIGNVGDSDSLGGETGEIKLDDPGAESTNDLPVEMGESSSSDSAFPVATDGDFSASNEVANDSSDGTQFITSFAEFELELKGDKAPYDKYKLVEDETIIGRNAKVATIAINDPEISSEHAKIIKRRWSCSLVDLKSANGTFHNGHKINEAPLNDGDVFKIGSTEFTFKVKSDLLNEESSRLMPVDENQVIIKEVEGDLGIAPITTEGLGEETETTGPKEKKSLVSKWKKLNPKQKLIYGSLGLLALLLLLDNSEEPARPNLAKEAQKKSNLLHDKSKDAANKNGSDKDQKTAALKKFSPEEQGFLESQYQLSKELYNQGKYSDAVFELQKIFSMTPEYKNSKQLYDWSKEGLAKLEELEKKRQAEIERKQKQERVKKLLEKTKQEVKEKNVAVAESLFSQILELDPENLDVTQLKIELEAWKKEQERIKFEKEQKEAERRRQVSLLTPAKTLYLKKEWYKATIKLEEFLHNKGLDEDLVKEGSDMLSDSKKNLSTLIDPMLGKARSLKEGQDLKGSYETYVEILKIEPSNTEALTEINDIRVTLDGRSKKIYREALISESLSLFEDAREKFQEVQQISPIDSEYYIKATEKLKDYLE